MHSPISHCSYFLAMDFNFASIALPMRQSRLRVLLQITFWPLNLAGHLQLKPPLFSQSPLRLAPNLFQECHHLIQLVRKHRRRR